MYLHGAFRMVVSVPAVTHNNTTKKEENKMLKKRNDRRLKGFGDFLREEEGMGTVEIILIIVDILTI